MKSVLAYPSWDQIDAGIARLVIDVITYDTFNPTLVVGLSRGGLIPAVRFSHLFPGDVNFAAVSYSAPSGKGETEHIEGGNTTSLHEVISYWSDIDDKQVIIIDDVVDTGHTMSFVADSFMHADWHVATACLHHRIGAAIIPTFVWQTINETDPWIHYPWEL